MANYPSSQNTDDNLYLAVNNLSTALDGAITAGDTTINVADASSFPSVGILTIDLEAIHYTGKTAASFTGCTRAFDGTTAAVHDDGATVFHDIPAAHHNVLKDEIKAISDDLRDAFTTNLDDTISPAATATDTKERFDHIATQVKNITGETDWKTIPSNTLSSLKGEVDTKLPLSGGTMTGAIAMSANKVTGLAEATANGDALRYEQLIGVYLPLSGGTLSGAIAMGSNKITGLAAGTTNGDALRYEQLIGVYLPLSGGTLSGNLQLPSGSLSNLSLRISDSDNGFWGSTNEFSAVVNGVNKMAWTNADIYIYDDTRPNADNTYSLGLGSARWSDVQSVLINGADYGFMNGWILREYPCTTEDVQTKTKQWMKDNAYKGIQILNKDGNLVCVIGHNGKIYASGFDSLANVTEL